MKNKLLLIETVILTIIICSSFGKKDTLKANKPYQSTSVTPIGAEKEVTNSDDSQPSQEIINEATGTLKQFVKGEITIDDVRIRLENYIDKKLAE